MKKVLFITLIIIPFLSFSQKKTVNLLESKVGPISLKYSMAIDLESQDTLSFVYLGFQNAKYTSITDIKSIFFSKDDIFKQFLKDLKIALEELKKNEKTNLNWDRSPNYQLKIYDFSKNLYVFEGEGTGGYTLLTQKNIQILIEQLSQIVEIGSYEIKKSN